MCSMIASCSCSSRQQSKHRELVSCEIQDPMSFHDGGFPVPVRGFTVLHTQLLYSESLRLT